MGLTRGYPYVKALTENKAISFDFANTDELGVHKLIIWRVDAFVVEEKSGLKAFEKKGLLEEMQYDPKQPLSKQDVYFATANTPRGKQLTNLISSVLKEMKRDGSFARIIGKAKKQ